MKIKRVRPKKPHNTVERFQCPQEFKTLAERRTRDIRATWARWGEDSLSILCQSCYLQGVEDGFKTKEALR